MVCDVVSAAGSINKALLQESATVHSRNRAMESGRAGEQPGPYRTRHQHPWLVACGAPSPTPTSADVLCLSTSNGRSLGRIASHDKDSHALGVAAYFSAALFPHVAAFSLDVVCLCVGHLGLSRSSRLQVCRGTSCLLRAERSIRRARFRAPCA